MKLFGSLRWDRGTGFFYRFKGGRDQRSLRTTALKHPFIQTVEDLIRLSVEGPSLEDFGA